MKIETHDNAAEMSADTVLTFPEGLPGFDGMTRFRLFHETDKPSLLWLESADDPNLQFSLTDPELLKVKYEITLSDSECEMLQLRDPADIAVLVMLYKDDTAADSPPGNDIRANFLGPLIINARNRIGMQKVLTSVVDFVTIRAE
jgi:flagellar assembly factor FliW